MNNNSGSPRIICNLLSEFCFVLGDYDLNTNEGISSCLFTKQVPFPFREIRRFPRIQWAYVITYSRDIYKMFKKCPLKITMMQLLIRFINYVISFSIATVY